MTTTKSSPRKRLLTIREWWDEVGTENVKEVAAALPTSMGCMRAYRYRVKRPSYDRAQKIVDLAKQFTPGFVPDLDSIMLPLPPRKPNPAYTPAIKPSARYVRSSRARQQGTSRAAA